MFNWKIITGTVVLTVIGRVILKMVELWNRGHENRKMYSGVPIPAGKHWLWGHLKHIDPNKTFDNLRKWMRELQYGMTQVWFGPAAIYLNLNCHHSDTLQPILVTAEPKSEMYEFVHGWIGKGLINSEGKRWARDRRLLTPAFHFDILKHYVHEFNSSAKCMLDRLEKKTGECVELFEAVSRMTLDSLLRCTLSVNGQDTDDKDAKEYLRCVHRNTTLVIERLLQPLVYNDFLYSLTANGKEWKRNCTFVNDFAKRVIRERQGKSLIAEHGAENNGDSSSNDGRKYLDLLDMLLAAKDEDERGLSENEILEQVSTFMFAGHDTTASGISFCLYNLAKHPEHQERCREEVTKLLDGRDSICWIDLTSLPYLTMCIKESFRIDPPVPEVGRKLSNPLTIKDKLLPKGSWITIAIYGVHHNPSIWENPETFDPLRFSPEKSRDRSPYAYIPFSAGPRNCIGQNFAMNEVKVVIALTLLRYRLEIVPEKPCIKQSLVITRAKNGLWIRLTPIGDN